ncbi:DUF6575 domain-containing protein [Thalassotalea castellviae]|uniref:DUF6575 domain-containing protein n=1 Tax=Thalassotalea castellviae TaxID=3075612 RepID=A0ABU2ZXX7_9GAMM|nr:DUF6575 domain-containing protein [Thalassotalea sp. W431]MDT0602535.1 hypothetical protein [Thalassotalea sp. W431]
MSKKSELLFIKSKVFGPLYYHNVYSFYDEPLIFNALNEFGQLFFCYALGCDEKDDRWIVVPISEQNANKLEQKDMPILSAIKQSANSSVLVIKTSLESGKQDEEYVAAKKLPYRLPTDKVFIRENVNYDGKRAHTHRIRIAKNNNAQIVSGILNKASEAFGEFCQGYLKKFDLSTKFFPQDAITGSFVYRVKADNAKQLKLEGYEILSKISVKDDFLAALDEREVDLRTVRKLFDLLLSNDLKIQLIDEESTETIIELSAEYVEDLIKEVDERLGSYLDSSMVPQADNLDTLRRYLMLIEKYGYVTATALKVVDRQVSYYRDACRSLSLTHNYSKLTPVGTAALTSETDAEFVKIIQRQFEETECGHIWMINQGVDSIIKIDENSAAEFLIENCNGLSDNTSRRRAQTLKSWVKKFKLHS